MNNEFLENLHVSTFCAIHSYWTVLKTRAQNSSETLLAYLFIAVYKRSHSQKTYLPPPLQEYYQTRHGIATTVRAFSEQSLLPYGIQMIHYSPGRISVLASVWANCISSKYFTSYLSKALPIQMGPQIALFHIAFPIKFSLFSYTFHLLHSLITRDEKYSVSMMEYLGVHFLFA
jgi:hypothetical protein